VTGCASRSHSQMEKDEMEGDWTASYEPGYGGFSKGKDGAIWGRNTDGP
jgi:hypothetical protein